MNTITTDKDKWRIECEPHIAIRLKRLFHSAYSRQGVVFLTKTPSNAKDLQWFFMRYSFNGDINSVENLAKEHDQIQSAVTNVLAEGKPSRKFELAYPPRDYQKVAADLCLRTGRLLLADELGTGKTISAITVLANGAPLPALVVTMTHLTNQWQRELEKFAPHLKTHIAKKGHSYPIEDKPDVMIMNYHKLAGWVQALAGKVQTVVFDEGQELRRDSSQKFNAAKGISKKAKVRLMCTGTPIYNYGSEFYNVLKCVDPNALGSRSEFIGEWCLSGYEKGKERIKDPAAFGAWLRQEGLMLRRTREDIGRELGELVKIPVDIDADTKALSKVAGTARELAEVVMAKAGLAKGEKMMAAERLTNMMRQATGVAKAPHVADFVKNIVEAEGKVVLFGWHRSVYDIWMTKLASLNPVLYTGSESPTQKEKAFRAFIEGNAKVFIMSLRSGAGLDGLQHHCNVAVFGELDWSPGVADQCLGRIFRDGQKKNVLAYYLLSNAGTDPLMSGVLGVKRGQINPVLTPQSSVFAAQQEESNARKLAELILKGE